MVRLLLIGFPDDRGRYLRLAARLRGGQVIAGIDGEDFNTWLTGQRMPFDALVIHSRKRIELSQYLRAAAAGKHLLIEGAAFTTSTDLTAAIDACRTAGVRLMIGQQLRFHPSVRTVTEALDSGRLGTPGLLRIHQWTPSPANEEEQRQLIPEIDLACWFFRDRPSVIYATGQAQHCPYTQLHLGFATGGMALIDRASFLPAGDSYFSLSLIGSAGAAYADDHHNMQVLFAGGPPRALNVGAGEGIDLALWQEFVNAIEEHREPLGNGSDGLRAVQVAEAAALSRSTGQAVHWRGDQYEVAGK